MAVKNTKFNLDTKDLEKTNVKSYKYCESCGTKTELSSKFCTECGSNKFFNSLEEYNDKKNSKYCLSCGLKLNAKMKFCTECGKSEFVSTKAEYDKYILDNKELVWKQKVEKLNKQLEKLTKEKENLNIKNKELKDIYQKEEKIYQTESNKLNEIIKNKKTKLESNEDKKVFEEKSYQLNKEKELISSSVNKLDERLSKELSQEKEKLEKLTKDNDKLEKEYKEMEKYVLSKREEYKEPDETVKVAAASRENKPFKLVVSNNCVTIGEYEGQPIVWNVINSDSNELLLISEECIDACDYSEVNRTEKNIEKTAFTAAERRYLLPIKKDIYGTEIYVTALKHEEVLRYLFRKEKRMCGYTKFVGTKANLRSGKISWWLYNGYELVNGNGNFSENVKTKSKHGIRPVIKIKKKL